MTLTVALVVAWVVTALVPLAWWLRQRSRVDAWRYLPVPAALVAPDGTVLDTTGPASDARFTVRGLPAVGQVTRVREPDGSLLAVTGVPGGGLAVALPADPVGERRDRVLAELGSRLAHEVNTPLTAVIGHLDLVAHEPISDAAQRSVRICQSELERIAGLTRDLLTLTSVRSGASPRSAELVGALVEEAVGGVLPVADEVGADLAVEVPAERVLVNVAAGDMIRAIRTLVVNALRHGLGQKRAVRVSVSYDATSVTVTVNDSGPGLTPAELVRLAEPMARGEGARGPGSGLGLAIASEVLAAHGSSLQTAPAPGGSAVSFTLRRLVP